MASSVSSVALVPFGAIASRSPTVRPAEAGLPAPAARGPESEALQSSQVSQAAPEGRSDTPPGHFRQGSQAGTETADRPGRSDSALFLAQVFAQDRPASANQPSSADVTRAYGGFREEPKTGFILDLPERVDLTV